MSTILALFLLLPFLLVLLVAWTLWRRRRWRSVTELPRRGDLVCCAFCRADVPVEFTDRFGTELIPLPRRVLSAQKTQVAVVVGRNVHVRCKVCAGEADDYPADVGGTVAYYDCHGGCGRALPRAALTAVQESPAAPGLPAGDVKLLCRVCRSAA